MSALLLFQGPMKDTLCIWYPLAFVFMSPYRALKRLKSCRDELIEELRNVAYRSKSSCNVSLSSRIREDKIDTWEDNQFKISPLNYTCSFYAQIL